VGRTGRARPQLHRRRGWRSRRGRSVTVGARPPIAERLAGQARVSTVTRSVAAANRAASSGRPAAPSCRTVAGPRSSASLSSTPHGTARGRAPPCGDHPSWPPPGRPMARACRRRAASSPCAAADSACGPAVPGRRRVHPAQRGVSPRDRRDGRQPHVDRRLPAPRRRRGDGLPAERRDPPPVANCEYRRSMSAA